ncbi:MAG TPA: DUF6306 domain-containing protein [Bacillota bacterium]|nr:DUF6306 domain-containing protein [Bacillota bacterium]
MKELVGQCQSCQTPVYCEDGFFHGSVQDNGEVLCFPCRDRKELHQLLNQLLEAEKAGVEALAFIEELAPEQELFKQVKSDESWSVAGLIACIRREKGQVSTNTGDFANKVKALETMPERLTLLNKGQSWVVKRIDQALKFAMEEESREFLTEMKVRHIENISQCEQIV